MTPAEDCEVGSTVMVPGILAFDYVGYVAAGWIVTVGAFGLYAARVIQRGRALSKAVPPEERRWG